MPTQRAKNAHEEYLSATSNILNTIISTSARSTSTANAMRQRITRCSEGLSSDPRLQVYQRSSLPMSASRAKTTKAKQIRVTIVACRGDIA